jgi:hypothetical protein
MFRTPLAALLITSSLALAEHPLSNPRVFVSTEGFRVVVATVKGNPNTCVLQLTGLRTELDGLVLDCTEERPDSQSRYSIVIRGRKRLALKTDGRGAAGLSETTGLLSYDEGQTKKEDLDALWARHQAQVAAGQLAAITKFDRAAEVAAITKTVNAAAEPIEGACGAKVPVTVDWAAASDEVFKSARAADGCLKVVELMAKMCGRWKVVRQTFAERIGELRCTYGADRPAFTIEGKTLTMASNENTVSLPGAFDSWVRDAL